MMTNRQLEARLGYPLRAPVLPGLSHNAAHHQDQRHDPRKEGHS
jgi:hypothetical protein